MTSEVEYTTKKGHLKRLVPFLFFMYLVGLLPVIMVLIVAVSSEEAWLNMGMVSIVMVTIITVLTYLLYRNDKDLFNTLNYIFLLNVRTFKGKTEQYNSIIEKVQEYLDKNNMKYAISFEGFKWRPLLHRFQIGLKKAFRLVFLQTCLLKVLLPELVVLLFLFLK